MKVAISVITSLLATIAAARPLAAGEGDPLPQTSRITAFVVDKDGQPSVECWEITSGVNTQQIQRTDGSGATSHALSLARNGDLDGIDILTWPSVSPIWPPSSDDEVRSASFNLDNTFNLFNVQGGLINFQFSVFAAPSGAAVDNSEDYTHIFSMENGDDWFYFEDTTSSSLRHKANAAPYPFEISTISATETELLRLRYNSQPKHTVIHKGACSFTGIKTPPADSKFSGAGTSGGHSGLTVQVNIDEAL